MQLENAAAQLDVVSKFLRSITIAGWFHAPDDRLCAAVFDHRDWRAVDSAVGLPHAGAAAQGLDKGFLIQCLLRSDRFPLEGRPTFRTTRRRYEAALHDLLEEAQRQQGGRLYARFTALAAAAGHGRILDVGGRARSGVNRALDFPDGSVTVFDIHAGANVDVVGDAHALSDVLPEQHFDAFFQSRRSSIC